jgi:hypothetical protein
MANLFTRAGMATSTSGTGTVTLGAALGAVALNLAPYQSFAGAGVADQTIVSYLILDSNQGWEIGTGTYTASGTTLSRTPKFSSVGGAAINLSGNAQIFIVPIAADGGDLLGGAANPFRGADSPVNLQLNAANNGTKLTIAVKGNNGNDPSPTNPVLIPLRDPTLANGGPKWAAVTAALSIDTNAAGATFGTANSVPFRLWIVAFYNSGAPVLAFWQGVTGGASPTALAALDPSVRQTSTAVSGSATSAGVFYTPNGTTVSNDVFAILGYVEYASGLGTAGTYNSNPTKIQLFGPGTRKPNDVVQRTSATGNTTTSNTTTSFVNAGDSASIAPSSVVNLIKFDIRCNGIYSNDAGILGIAAVFRGGAAGGTQVGNSAIVYSTGGAIQAGCAIVGLDAPGTTSSTSYQGAIKSSTATHLAQWGSVGQTPATSILLEELFV